MPFCGLNKNSGLIMIWPMASSPLNVSWSQTVIFKALSSARIKARAGCSQGNSGAPAKAGASPSLPTAPRAGTSISNVKDSYHFGSRVLERYFVFSTFFPRYSTTQYGSEDALPYNKASSTPCNE